MRWIFLGLSAVLCALSSLTLVPAWHVVVWKAAIVAGEYGHYLGLLTMVLVCVIVAFGIVMEQEVRPYWGASGVAVVLAVIATGFFFSPAAYALRVGQRLPSKMAEALAIKTDNAPVLDLVRMWLPWPRVEPVSVSTHAFTPVDWPQRLELDFYAGIAPHAPVVLLVHGGGWDGGNRRQFAEFNHWLARQGYAVAAMDYRLAPRFRWPAPRDDVWTAVLWLKKNAAALGIDATRMVLMGRSAGAQIASAVACGAHDPAVRGFVGVYGVYDMDFAWSVSRDDDVLNSVKLMTQYFGGEPGSANRAAYASASAQGLVHPEHTPPILLLHGTIDTLCWVEHSRRMARTLQSQNVPHVLVELPWAVHGFDYNLTGPGGQLMAYAVATYLESVCSP